VNGWKNIENRYWATRHRGDLLIHAAQTMTMDDYDACRIFGTVLGPDYNAVHRDHLHLEATDTQFCR
jgi:hypothetical protein